VVIYLLTIRDIASKAGVSVSTVSRVLNDSKPVSEEIKMKVLNVIEETGFKPNSLARSFVTGKTNLIGIIVPELANTNFSHLVRGAEGIANDFGYNVLLSFTDFKQDNELKYLKIMKEKHVDGIILSGVSFNEEQKKFFEENRKCIPTVIVGQNNSSINIPYVNVNNERIAYDSVNYLLRLGHENIGFISADIKDSSAGGERYLGYKRALREKNIKENKDFIQYASFDFRSGYEAMKEILKKEKHPTAILCANDVIAIGAINCILDNGYTVPDDFSVMGIDNSDFSHWFRPALTTVNIDFHKFGVLAMEQLIKCINNNQLTNEKKGTFIEHELIPRNTCKKI
jgi:LacI family transcriptional regulator